MFDRVLNEYLRIGAVTTDAVTIMAMKYTVKNIAFFTKLIKDRYKKFLSYLLSCTISASFVM